MRNSLQFHRPGAELTALCLGNPQGEPMLALHGWLDNGASFLPLARHLPEYRMVALDFPGHGHSNHRPLGAGYLFVDYIADVAYAIQSLDWPPFHLVGHSLGANVALAVSAVFPKWIKTLVLLDGVGPTSGRAEDTVSRLRRSIGSQIDKAVEPDRTYPDWETLIDARCRASPISRQGAELLVRRNAHEESGRVRVHSDRRLRIPSPMYLTEAAVLELVGSIRAPTLAILAEQGSVITHECTHQRIASNAGITKITLPGTHHLHMDTPRPVADAMRSFLTSPCLSGPEYYGRR